MQIRRAKECDMEQINKLLLQVCMVHHIGRPDLFKRGGKKYTDEQLRVILRDDERPVFVATDEKDVAIGYAFCIFERHEKSGAFMPFTTLYIDDLCVDQDKRGKHIGKALYDFVLDFAKQNDCYNVTLNVWNGNEGAMKFYESCGLKIQKIGMEIIL